MTIFDVRQRCARAVLTWGGKVDPATYPAAHPDSVTTSNTLSFSPDSSRGPYLAWGLQRSPNTPVSRMIVSIEARRLTPTPVAFNALCHLALFTGEGIDLSQWPAPLLVEQAQSVGLFEEVIDPSDVLADVSYALVGFHTDLDSFARVRAQFGEFRGWGIEVQPDVTVASGQATDRYTMTEATTVVEYLQTVYSDPGPTPLDMVRVRLDDKDILFGERVATTSVGILGPVRLGIPASALGVNVRPGNTFQVSEKISASTRHDAWSFLGVAR